MPFLDCVRFSVVSVQHVSIECNKALISSEMLCGLVEASLASLSWRAVVKLQHRHSFKDSWCCFEDF
jgi:hypothetical protein